MADIIRNIVPSVLSNYELTFVVVSLLFALAAILGQALLLPVATGSHIYQAITTHNLSAGNAGVFFYRDILVPLFGLTPLILQRQFSRPAAAS